MAKHVFVHSVRHGTARLCGGAEGEVRAIVRERQLVASSYARVFAYGLDEGVPEVLREACLVVFRAEGRDALWKKAPQPADARFGFYAWPTDSLAIEPLGLWRACPTLDDVPVYDGTAGLVRFV